MAKKETYQIAARKVKAGMTVIFSSIQYRVVWVEPQQNRIVFYLEGGATAVRDRDEKVIVVVK